MSNELYEFSFFNDIKKIDYDSWIFPGGEIGVRLSNRCSNPMIISRLRNSNDVVQLLMVTDALSRTVKTKPVLYMPYVPYGRQDRITVKGEAFSLSVFADLLKGKFYRIVIIDPHSDVTSSLLGIENECVIISQSEVISEFNTLLERVSKESTVLVSPDAGSNKKSYENAKVLGLDNFVRADKLRDVNTGNILETIVYCDDFHGKDVLCCDDICDGGRTFVELAKACKKKNCGNFILYVTHGIFSKGLSELTNNGIEVFTTNSIYQPQLSCSLDENHVLPIEQFMSFKRM